MIPSRKTPRLLNIQALKIFLFLSISMILLTACASSQPQIAPAIDQFEFGEVVNGKVLTKDIEITNAGTAPLLVDSVSTSCGCTTAALTPMQIEAGGAANLHIEFDSGAHGPEFNGALTRQIFIASNDPKNPEVVIEFTAVVLPPESAP
jgi:hypothetical protein